LAQTDSLRFSPSRLRCFCLNLGPYRPNLSRHFRECFLSPRDLSLSPFIAELAQILRKHMTLKETPAMASGLEDHVWTIRELIEESAKF
jgi:hypothetical protein